MVNTVQIENIGSILNNRERPLKERFRALFTLKNIGGVECIKAISRCFEDDSALLKHELAYCLGQMQDEQALDILAKELENKLENNMVRHEAAEALGAIGSSNAFEILRKFKDDTAVEVAETCTIALDRIKWLESAKAEPKGNIFHSIDPAPPYENVGFEDLKKIYLSKENSLFDRYRALFSLRNIGNDENILVIVEGLNDSSALFRHEVAFVLGQLKNPCSIPYLIARLEDRRENEMVRHECAEALGAIANEECFEVLKKFVDDDNIVVKQSCEIALDIMEYDNSEEFQYANGLSK